MINTGVYHDLDNIDYHNNIECEALSSSSMQKLLKSPAHYKSWVDGKTEITKALVFGSAYHTYVLQNDAYRSDVEVKKSVSVANRDEAYHSGVSLITQVEHNAICYMAESLYKTKTWEAISSRGPIFETSIFWQDEEYDFICKCRPDILIDDIGIVCDLKTTADAEYYQFQRSIINYGYDIQAAHYLSGVQNQIDKQYKDFMYIVCEKTDPYQVAFYRASEDMITNANDKINEAKRIYAECISSGNWYGYEDCVIDMEIPKWAVKK